MSCLLIKLILLSEWHCFTIMWWRWWWLLINALYIMVFPFAIKWTDGLLLSKHINISDSTWLHYLSTVLATSRSRTRFPRKAWSDIMYTFKANFEYTISISKMHTLTKVVFNGHINYKYLLISCKVIGKNIPNLLVPNTQCISFLLLLKKISGIRCSLDFQNIFYYV